MIKTIQVEVFSILIITLLLLGLFYIMGKAIKKADPLQKPQGLVLLGIILHSFFKDFTESNMGKKAAIKYAPYIATLGIYLVFANLSGLFGLTSPTANYSVTLSLTLITFFFIIYTKISVNGFGGFLHSFIEPYVPFVVMNVFGTISPLISMSLRLFGNMTAGTVLMLLFYQFTGLMSEFIPFIGQLNIFGMALAPALHAYFDVFAGLIQTYIFISLTTILVGVEIPQEE